MAAKGRGVFDHEGHCIQAIGTAIDVTARKVIEERLRELNETLEAQAAERTVELGRAWKSSQNTLAAIAPCSIIIALNASRTQPLVWPAPLTGSP